MGLYTIAITPETAGHIPVQMTIRAEIGTDVSHIIEIAVRSAGPGGLSQGAFPEIDLHAIAQVLLSGAAVSQREPVMGGGLEAGPDSADRSPSPRRHQEAAAADSNRAATRRRSPRPSRAGTDGPAARIPRDGSERVYRRMPGAHEVLAVYEKFGTVTGVAKHYGVPRYTAQGWMGRIRKASE